MEAQALRQRGWTISAIARHLERDRKNVHAYLSGPRSPGVRARSRPDLLAPFVEYLTARFADDPRGWAFALYDEVRPSAIDRAARASSVSCERLDCVRTARRVPA